MPIIVILFHRCNFSAKLQLYQNPVNVSSWRQIQREHRFVAVFSNTIYQLKTEIYITFSQFYNPIIYELNEYFIQ